MPSPGTISFYHAPGGLCVRVDGAAFTGFTVPPYYDSLIAKLICYAPNRSEAIRRAQVALGEFAIEGVATTIPFHQALLTNPYFLRGEISTDFLNKHQVLTAGDEN
jgi:acetyl-CoA carboxylase biotin carboxylase subunit